MSQEPEAVEDSAVIPDNLDATVSDQEPDGDRTCDRNISIVSPSPDQNVGRPQRIRKPPDRCGQWVHAQHISTDDIFVCILDIRFSLVYN